jgi:hypothetical protein
MAHPSLQLIDALRHTALNLQNGNTYAWGNHGSCNCGNLLQTITGHTAKEILKQAHTGNGEWTELATEYCGVTNKPVEDLISTLANIGLTPSDVHHIEYLSDKNVLNALPGGFRWLSRNKREDVIVYFNTMAQLLLEQLRSNKTITITELTCNTTISQQEPQYI